MELSYFGHADNRNLSKRGRQRQRREARKYFFVILVFYVAYLHFACPVCFYFHWNSVDSSVSFWTKRWTLVLEMSATFWRQRGNGAVEVSFESRTVQMSALFHIFTCAFWSYCFTDVAVAVLGYFAILLKIPNVAAVTVLQRNFENLLAHSLSSTTDSGSLLQTARPLSQL